jgi:hypothetical protein
MPLRDHFHPPVSKLASWEALHGQWPAVIVQQLKKQLPAGFVSEPRVHFGAQIEVDVATAVWAPARPTVAVETELPDYDEYEVRIYDAERGRQLVAVVELVSPANKDRPEKRNAFVGKCAALLQKGVAVSIVDLVTTRQFNLYAELMAFLDLSDPTLGTEPPPVYAASCRWVRGGKQAVLQTWSHILALGQPLPILPLWLTDLRAVPLDLEQSYEKACDDLSIA